jgi:hypothetical protein
MDTAENRKTLKYGWLRGQWIEDGLWHPEDLGSNALKREAARFFEQNYDSIIKLHAQ